MALYSTERSLAGARELWAELDRATQLEVARRVAAERSRELQRRIPNVLSVGVGYRTRRDVDRPLEAEICLRFLVAKKWTRRRKGGVPPEIEAYVELDGRRRRCAVPTDVAEIGRGRTQGDQDLGGGILARPLLGGGAGLMGAVGCLVRDRDRPESLYLLGCHHVFTRSLRQGNCEPAASGTRILRRDDKSAVGRTVFFAPLLPPGGGFGLDAALAQVEDEDRVSAELHGVEPLRVAPEGEMPQPYRILAPRGPLDAFFVSEQFALDLPYQCGRTIRVRRALESLAASTPTRPGDSGSPLLAADGTLYGMHFYGTDLGRSLALPADELFADDVFPVRIELAIGHDP